MKKTGFTILELAIVMTIIGLIVGSIFAGQSMMRSSQMQNALGEYDAYVKALGEFQTKFFALPGDMTNAESMWGSDSACPNTAVTTTPHIATCNGDGSGTIGSSDFDANLTNTTEWFRAWQQLSDSGFANTAFSGTPGAGGVQEIVPGQNAPGSAMSGSGWGMLYYSLTTTSTALWGDQYGHIFTFGAFKAGGLNVNPVMTAGEAFAFDQKIDDGKPGTGIVRAWRTAVLPHCTTNDSSQTAQAYATTDTDRVCSLIMLMRN